MSARKIGEPCEPCPYAVWIEVKVLRKPRTDPPVWWPPEPAAPYANEPFTLKLSTGTAVEDTLAAGGNVRLDQISKGPCVFTLGKFFEAVEAELAPPP